MDGFRAWLARVTGPRWFGGVRDPNSPTFHATEAVRSHAPALISELSKTPTKKGTVEKHPAQGSFSTVPSTCRPGWRLGRVASSMEAIDLKRTTAALLHGKATCPESASPIPHFRGHYVARADCVNISRSSWAEWLARPEMQPIPRPPGDIRRPASILTVDGGRRVPWT